MDIKIYWIWLQLIFGVDNNNFFEIYSKYNNPYNLFNDLYNNKNIKLSLNDNQKVRLKNISIAYVEKIYVKTLKNNFDIICYDDEYYPSKLKYIYSPPMVLYATKNFRYICNNFSISVVGSRNPSVYGRNATIYITKDLVENNVTIISGLAYGIDTVSHETALKHDGNTIAVLGCGLDKTYPIINLNVRKSIEIKGAVVSEFVIGTEPIGKNFPLRNRIIAGLSDGVLVTEASNKSGTFITTNYAFDYGRDVFAVPSNIFCKNLQGTNNLIKKYAKITTSAKDILEEYSHIFNKVKA